MAAFMVLEKPDPTEYAFWSTLLKNVYNRPAFRETFSGQ